MLVNCPSLNDAIVYLSPHKFTGDKACILLTAGRVRDALRVLGIKVA